MKRATISVLLLMLVLLASAIAQQEPQKPPAGQMGKMGMMPGMMHGQMQGMTHGEQDGPMGGMKLTDEQQSKIQDLHLAHQKEVLPLRSELQKQHANLKLELTADKFNESKVKSLQGEISKLMNEMSTKMILHRRAVRDLLTPEQRKHFDQRILSGGPMGPGQGMRQGAMMRRGGMMRGGGMMGQHGMMGPQGCPQGPTECMCKCKK